MIIETKYKFGDMKWFHTTESEPREYFGEVVGVEIFEHCTIYELLVEGVGKIFKSTEEGLFDSKEEMQNAKKEYLEKRLKIEQFKQSSINTQNE